MICDKCKKDIVIEEHHLWPKYMDNPHGNSYKGFVSRVWLCRECHTGDFGLHQTVIIPLLKEYSIKPQYNSEHYLWLFVPKELQYIIIDICVARSWRWINADS